MDVVGDLWFSKRQGETLLKTFTFANDDGTPLALTSPLMQGVRRNAPSDRIDFAPTVGGTDGNVVTITKTPDDTWALTPGDYLWDLVATDVTDGQLVRLEGVFEVVRTYSQPGP